MENEELRHDAEKGRRYKIALEVWRDFLDCRRRDIVLLLEEGTYSFAEGENVLRDALSELRVMKSFERDAKYYIQQGEIAEEELRNGGY